MRSDESRSANETLRDLAVELAVSAGEIIRAESPARVRVAATKSTLTDPVTEMDHRIEQYLVTQLRHQRPQDGLLGEEGDESAGESGLTWVIDPIDGTVNYLYGVAGYAVSVAVVAGDPNPHTWRPLAGCVHRVTDGVTWAAAAGSGATRNGFRLHLGAAEAEPSPPLGQCLVATGFGYDARRRAAQARVLAAVLPQVRDIRRLGSAAIDLCLLAEGSVDLYYERGLNPWDFAAAALIATEAGAQVCGLAGARGDTQMLLAGRDPALTELRQILRDCAAATPGPGEV